MSGDHVNADLTCAPPSVSLEIAGVHVQKYLAHAQTRRQAPGSPRSAVPPRSNLPPGSRLQPEPYATVPGFGVLTTLPRCVESVSSDEAETRVG